MSKLMFGDVSGHDFHGNQYTGGAASGNQDRATANAREKHHNDKAKEHWNAAINGPNAGGPGAKAHLEARKAHQVAAQSYGQAVTLRPGAWDRAELDAKWAAGRSKVAEGKQKFSRSVLGQAKRQVYPGAR